MQDDPRVKTALGLVVALLDHIGANTASAQTSVVDLSCSIASELQTVRAAGAGWSIPARRLYKAGRLELERPEPAQPPNLESRYS
jgi:hypothetical protein